MKSQRQAARVVPLSRKSIVQNPAAEQRELPDVAEADGRRVVIKGHEEIVLPCEETSITLRANGKVIIRGAQIESHARGLNRIKGGGVKVN